ncbi:MAG: histidine--tRNA ligase [Candidatus Omnitrophica bacterium]|nr:histidine--tRNA ligase [Candidatus Omnitrophota bacterium]
MKIEPRTLKGFRDFLPNEARKRQYVINILKRVFESYGFEPLETPTLEYAEILTGKYGDEGDKLMYRFKDKGDRDVAMRYDQTVPLARVVAQYGEKIPMPFKRYQIQNVWRAENTQKGRFREFLQCDIDTVGSYNVSSDIEIISCISSGLKKLGFNDFKIIVNDREIFKDVPQKAITIIDKLKKIGEDGVKAELKEKGFDSNILENIRTSKQTERIMNIFSNSQFSALSSQLTFSPTLARGLDYYTGLIFEIEIEGYSAGSVAGGGRYDELIGMFTDKKIPAVGGSLGFDRLIDAMEELNLFPKDLQTTKVLVLNLPNLEDKAMEIAGKLRLTEINAEVYLDSDVEKGKQFAYAEKKNIPYTISILENETFTLGWKNENGEVEKKENLSFENLLEQLEK